MKQKQARRRVHQHQTRDDHLSRYKALCLGFSAIVRDQRKNCSNYKAVQWGVLVGEKK